MRLLFIHKESNGYWTVRHMDTGHDIHWCNTRAEAVAYLRAHQAAY